MPLALPPPFRTILMDPPWPETGGGKVKRGADRHYPLLKARDIYPTIRLSCVWRPATDAHLYCWATNNYLPHALQLMASLDFRYVTNLCWVKQKDGLGQYFRGRHELLLFGVRGDGYAVRTARRDLSTVSDKLCVGAPRGKHSAKPVAFYAVIEARSKGPYLEMFARSERPGWSSWGNELPANDDRAMDWASAAQVIEDPDTGERYEPECEWCGQPTIGLYQARACCEACFELIDAGELDVIDPEEPGP